MYRVFYRDDGVLIAGSREKGFWSMHCDITHNFLSHWRKKKEILNTLPSVCYAIQKNKNRKLGKFLRLLGARKQQQYMENNEMKTLWRFPNGDKSICN